MAVGGSLPVERSGSGLLAGSLGVECLEEQELSGQVSSLSGSVSFLRLDKASCICREFEQKF